MATINGRQYPALDEQFLYDLRIALGMNPDVQPGQLPAAYEREFPVTFEATKSLRGLGFRTQPGTTPKVIATWAYPKPDGSICTMDATVPEEVRSQLAGASLTGDQMVTGVYEATKPEVLARFNADWGVDP